MKWCLFPKTNGRNFTVFTRIAKLLEQMWIIEIETGKEQPWPIFIFIIIQCRSFIIFFVNYFFKWGGVKFVPKITIIFFVMWLLFSLFYSVPAAEWDNFSNIDVARCAQLEAKKIISLTDSAAKNSVNLYLNKRKNWVKD